MSENKGYYSGNSNILETLIDCSIDSLFLVGKLSWKFLKWSMDGWIDWNKSDKKDLNYFYQTTGSKNKLGEFPTVVKTNDDKNYILKSPVGMNIDDFEKTKKSLEAYLDKDVDIQLDNGYLVIKEAIKKELARTIPYNQNKRTVSHIKFNIGQSIDNTITLDLKENPHSYIVGTTGSGKSVMTKVILTNLVTLYNPNELELWLCDLKRVELNLFRNVEHCKKFVYTVEATTEVIADLLEETNRRYDLFMEHEVTNIFEYNKLPNVKKLKYQVLYLEEIIMLLEDKKKNAMKLLKQLIAISRASGLYVFLTTQRPSNDIIDNVVKANINNRIVLKCEDSKNSIVALDREGAELLRGNGHGIIKRGCQNEEFQAYFLEDKQVKELIKPYIKPKEKIKPINDKLIEDKNKTSEKPNTSPQTALEELNQVAITKEHDNIIDLSFLDKL